MERKLLKQLKALDISKISSNLHTSYSTTNKKNPHFDETPKKKDVIDQEMIKQILETGFSNLKKKNKSLQIVTSRKSPKNVGI